MIRILSQGNWSKSQVWQAWTATGRRIVPEVETAIDQAWHTALARPGVHLFDGPMCRLESWQASSDRLELSLSKSNYKIFVGTNMAHPEFSDKFGSDVMANPVGISPALVTADHYLLLGRRTSAVAYYPDRVHPFSGCLEPEDADLFAAVTRELDEELSLGPADISDIRCIGIAEDANLVQPELIFSAQTLRTKAKVEATLDKLEHRSIYAIAATANAIESAIKDPKLTPVAIAALLLWGRLNIDQEWFEKLRPA